MAIYVDVPVPDNKRNSNSPKSCRLYADTKPELEMAMMRLHIPLAKIERRRGNVSYCWITEGKRAKAIRYGAVEHTEAEAAKFRIGTYDRGAPTRAALLAGIDSRAISVV